MVTSEREMVKHPEVPQAKEQTSLQPTYEDTMPTAEDDWELEEEQ